MVTRAQQAPAVDGTWRNALQAAAWTALGVAAALGVWDWWVRPEWAAQHFDLAIALMYLGVGTHAVAEQLRAGGPARRASWYVSAWGAAGVVAVVGLMVLSIGTQFASSLVPFTVAAWYAVLASVVAPRGGGTVGLWGCVVLAAWIVTVLILGMVVY